jgi:hypothetical protein
MARDILAALPHLRVIAVVSYHGVLPADHSAGDKFLDGNLVRPAGPFERQLQFLKARITRSSSLPKIFGHAI